MSQENVELAHRAYDAVNRRDFGVFLRLMDADVEGISIVVGMEGSYHGHAGIRRWWENMLDVFPDLAIEVVEVRDVGDVTLSTLNLHGHGAGSHTPFRTPLWLLSGWRQGKCVRWRSYETETEALEAVGLRD